MARKESTDVNVSETAEDGVVKTIKPFERMLRQMELAATLEESDANFNGDDLSAILEAETEEEIFAGAQRAPLGGRDLGGCELAIHDVQVKISRQAGIKSNFAYGGKSMYLIASATRISDAGDQKDRIRLPEIGEMFQFNTSARYLTAQLWKAYELGLISELSSWEVKVESIDLGDGQNVVKLVPLPKRVERG